MAASDTDEHELHEALFLTCRALIAARAHDTRYASLCNTLQDIVVVLPDVSYVRFLARYDEALDQLFAKHYHPYLRVCDPWHSTDYECDAPQLERVPLARYFGRLCLEPHHSGALSKDKLPAVMEIFSKMHDARCEGLVVGRTAWGLRREWLEGVEQALRFTPRFLTIGISAPRPYERKPELLTRQLASAISLWGAHLTALKLRFEMDSGHSREAYAACVEALPALLSRCVALEELDLSHLMWRDRLMASLDVLPPSLTRLSLNLGGISEAMVQQLITHPILNRIERLRVRSCDDALRDMLLSTPRLLALDVFHVNPPYLENADGMFYAPWDNDRAALVHQLSRRVRDPSIELSERVRQVRELWHGGVGEQELAALMCEEMEARQVPIVYPQLHTLTLDGLTASACRLLLAYGPRGFPHLTCLRLIIDETSPYDSGPLCVMGRWDALTSVEVRGPLDVFSSVLSDVEAHTSPFGSVSWLNLGLRDETVPVLARASALFPSLEHLFLDCQAGLQLRPPLHDVPRTRISLESAAALRRDGAFARGVEVRLEWDDWCEVSEAHALRALALLSDAAYPLAWRREVGRQMFLHASSEALRRVASLSGVPLDAGMTWRELREAMTAGFPEDVREAILT